MYFVLKDSDEDYFAAGNFDLNRDYITVSGGLHYLNPSGPNSARVNKKRNTDQSSADDTTVSVRDEVDAGIINKLSNPS